MTPRDHDVSQKALPRAIEQRAYSVVDSHQHFHGRARHFEFKFRQGVLVVRGSVPTYYLKQMLQHVLVGMDGVCRIDNQVQVISTTQVSDARDF
jgi:hypothetical protein